MVDSTTSPASTPLLDLPHEEIEAFCRHWRIIELAVFGSALRDDFGPESDIDFLVTFAPGTTWSLLSKSEMHENSRAARTGRRSY